MTGTYKINEKELDALYARCYARINELDSYIDKYTKKDAEKYADKIEKLQMEITVQFAMISAYDEVGKVAVYTKE